MSAYPRKGFRGPRNKRPQKEDPHRVNDRILAREVLFIDDAGEQVGVISIEKALEAAEEKGLDLVEVSPNSTPPVCKLMDYGKFKYQEQKKLHEAKKRLVKNTEKELRLRYSTDIGDIERLVNQARDFLEKGDKVRFTMRFRGREMEHREQGRGKLKHIAEQLKDCAEEDSQGSKSNSPRQLHMVLTPKKAA